MPKRILKPHEISTEPEITFDDEGNTVLVSDTKVPAAGGAGAPKEKKSFEERYKEAQAKARKMNEEIGYGAGQDYLSDWEIENKKELSKYIKEQRVGKSDATIKKELHEAVKEAAINLQKVWEETKDMLTPLGARNANARSLLGKAREKVRSAAISKGGGEVYELDGKEVLSILKKYFTQDK